jgi:DNA-directed RNA polymerase specialized sigma24 family protein
MANQCLGTVFCQVRKLIGTGSAHGSSDGDLLERFIHQHDESAFEALVQRHGPMVLGVCRRILHDAHAAEDAFQATFLVLVRKAATISQRDSLGSWLYRVAYHLALRARSSADRCRARSRCWGRSSSWIAG